MTTKAGVGMSRHHNPSVAGREAAEQALQKAGVDRPDIVIMFASIGYDQHSLLQTVRETTRGAPLTGCSAEGTIDGNNAEQFRQSVGPDTPWAGLYTVGGEIGPVEEHNGIHISSSVVLALS